MHKGVWDSNLLTCRLCSEFCHHLSRRTLLLGPPVVVSRQPVVVLRQPVVIWSLMISQFGSERSICASVGSLHGPSVAYQLF